MRVFGQTLWHHNLCNVAPENAMPSCTRRCWRRSWQSHLPGPGKVSETNLVVVSHTRTATAIDTLLAMLRRCGAEVVATDLKPDMCKDTMASIKALGRQVEFVPCDVRDRISVDDAFKQVEK